MYECDDCVHVKSCESAGAEEFDGKAESCPDFKLKTRQVGLTTRELRILIDAITNYYDLDFQHHTPEEYEQLKTKLLNALYEKKQNNTHANEAIKP
jgi:hypothetical protein